MIIKLISNTKKNNNKHELINGQLTVNHELKFNGAISFFKYSISENQSTHNSNAFLNNNHNAQQAINLNADLNNAYQQNTLLKQKHAHQNTPKQSKKLDNQEYLANISHELRTPLNAINGLCSLLEKTQLSPEQSDYIESLKISSTNMLGMVNTLLFHSKLSSGQETLEIIDVDIIELVQNVRRTLKQEALAKNLHFTCDFDAHLPRFIKTDAIKLTQVLMNLLSNAIKFTHIGSVSLNIGFKKQTDFNALIINVKDTGIGIENSDFISIFERYKQSAVVKEKGTGLGLAIVKSIVDLFGGNITVKSELLKGTTFQVEIPIEKAIEYNESNLNANKAILVVEDNVINQKILFKLLENSNVNLVFKNTGSEAVEFLTKSKVDLVLMDIHLPDIDGFEVKNLMKFTINTNTAVIGFTANRSKEIVEKCMHNGFLDCINKNFELQKILSLVTQNTTFQSLDLTYLNDISGGDVSFEKKIITEALIQIPNELLDLSKAIDAVDYLAIINISHKLSSSFSVIGFKPNSNFEEFKNSRVIDKTELLKVFSSLKMHYINYESLITTKYNPL